MREGFQSDIGEDGFSEGDLRTMPAALPPRILSAHTSQIDSYGIVAISTIQTQQTLVMRLWVYSHPPKHASQLLIVSMSGITFAFDSLSCRTRVMDSVQSCTPGPSRKARGCFYYPTADMIRQSSQQIKGREDCHTRAELSQGHRNYRRPYI